MLNVLPSMFRRKPAGAQKWVGVKRVTNEQRESRIDGTEVSGEAPAQWH